MSRLTSILILLGAAGIVASTYLASYQLGVIGGVWDPLFGDGSERVLTSGFSRMLPVPDALLGALAYLVDIVLALLIAEGVGGRSTRLVLAVVAGLGALASVGLVGLQAFVVHAFCTLCLVSAGVSWALAAGAVLGAREDADLPLARHKEVEST